MLFYLLLIGLAVFIIWRVSKLYSLSTYDTVVAFTGGLGSGKSFLSVKTALKLLKRKRREVRWHNFWHKQKKPRPLLYSSIPIKISRKENSTLLTGEHLTLQQHLVLNSVVLLDEVGGFCSQFDYRVDNSEMFEEFVRFFRHYVQGYLVVNDQCSENIVLQVRRRLNTVYNLMCFRKRFFGLFYTVKVRNISVSEEIKTIEEENTEDNMRTLLGLMPWTRHYDTHCYSERYNYVPIEKDVEHVKMKTNKIIRITDVSGAEALDERVFGKHRQKPL